MTASQKIREARDTETRTMLEDRIGYLLNHCDSDEEIAIVKWSASHIAAAFGLPYLTVNGARILADS